MEIPGKACTLKQGRLRVLLAFRNSCPSPASLFCSVATSDYLALHGGIPGKDFADLLRSGSHVRSLTCGQTLCQMVTGLHCQQKAGRAASEGRSNAEQAAPEPSLELLSRGGRKPERTCMLGSRVGITDDSFFPFYS